MSKQEEEMDNLLSSPKANVARAANVMLAHGSFIRTIILNNTDQKDLVEDLMQNLFISLVRRPIPDDVKTIKSYLYRAITHDIIDEKRKIIRYRNHLRIFLRSVEYGVQRPPEVAMINSEEACVMLELMEEKLSPYLYQALKLRYCDSLSNPEIASKMDVSTESATKYIFLGLKKLRTLAPECRKKTYG